MRDTNEDNVSCRLKMTENSTMVPHCMLGFRIILDGRSQNPKAVLSNFVIGRAAKAN